MRLFKNLGMRVRRKPQGRSTCFVTFDTFKNRRCWLGCCKRIKCLSCVMKKPGVCPKPRPPTPWQPEDSFARAENTIVEVDQRSESSDSSCEILSEYEFVSSKPPHGQASSLPGCSRDHVSAPLGAPGTSQTAETACDNSSFAFYSNKEHVCQMDGPPKPRPPTPWQPEDSFARAENTIVEVDQRSESSDLSCEILSEYEFVSSEPPHGQASSLPGCSRDHVSAPLGAPGTSQTAETACDKSSFAYYRNTEHVCQMDGPPKFKKNSIVCPHCPEKFSTYSSFVRHYLVHLPLPINNCSLCGKRMLTKQSLRKHVDKARQIPPSNQYVTRSGRVSKKRIVLK